MQVRDIPAVTVGVVGTVAPHPWWQRLADLSISDWAAIVGISYTAFLFVLKIRDEFFPRKR